MTEVISEIFLPLVSLLLGGGTVAAWFKFRRAENESATKAITDLLDRYSTDNIELRKSNEDMRSRLNSLEVKVVLLEASSQDLPLPMWLKDIDGTMLAINQAYENTFLIPRGYKQSDYIGKKDSAVWSKEVALGYAKHDNYVLKTRNTFDGIESVQVNGHVEEWRIIKFLRFSGNVVIGIGGIAIPNNKIKSK